MDINRFTEKSQEALQGAQALAVRRNHQGVDIEHVLAALLTEHEGLASALLAGAGMVGKGEKGSGKRRGIGT